MDRSVAAAFSRITLTSSSPEGCIQPGQIGHMWYRSTDADHSLKALQVYKVEDFNIWRIGVQNEPRNSDTTHRSYTS